jgi:hypothetical protein
MLASTQKVIDRRTIIMKSYITGLALLALAVSVQVAPAAEVTGKITLKGTPKPEVPIDLGPICGKLHDGPVTTRHFVVGPNHELANVFVYIKEGAPKTPPKGEATVLDQKGCLYEPYVMGVVTGQKFKIRNSDPFMHNVHATPKINSEFNFAQPVKGQENEKAFDKPEVLVRMMCNVHGWMFAWIGVVDHPYFAVTDKDGSFKIPNLPAGTYTIEAFHPKIGQLGAKTEKITVTDSDKKSVNFELEAPAAK